MKLTIKTTIAAIVLSAAFAGQAFAAVSHGDLIRAINESLISGSNVLVTLNGNTAILTGTTEGSADATAVVTAAENVDGVERVIDHTFSSK